MDGVRLVSIDDGLVDACTRDAGRALGRIGTLPGDVLPAVAEVVAQTGAMLRATPRPAPWGAYLAVAEALADTARPLVGTCAFKTAPQQGRVEIAYHTFAPFEGRGFATAMARELVRIASGSTEVGIVIAHTLPEENASTRLLRRLGFRARGEVVDPEDGRVWRWELPLGAKRTFGKSEPVPPGVS